MDPSLSLYDHHRLSPSLVFTISSFSIAAEVYRLAICTFEITYLPFFRFPPNSYQKHELFFHVLENMSMTIARLYVNDNSPKHMMATV